jgi:hypothetical protein
MRRLIDREPVAEVTGGCGLLDLERRKLVDRPVERWRSLARFPELLGLARSA